MANDPKNIQLGPCRVRWGGIDLGLTKGGVEVEVTTDTKEVMVDQFGNTPVNEYITGRKLTVKCPFAETDLDTLHTLMRNSGATLVDDGVRASGTIVLGSQPPANDTVTVNGTVFTFKTAATATGLRDVAIGATQAATLQNLVTVLQSSTDAKVAEASYAITTAGTTITVTYGKTGTAGNAFTLARTGTAVTVPATLTGGVVSTRRRVEVANGVGISIQANAQELWLRPISADDNDFSQDFVVPLAGTGGGLTFAYQNDEERVFNLTFAGYPNTATRVLFVYGDKRSA
jgi:hypothetical protein